MEGHCIIVQKVKRALSVIPPITFLLFLFVSCSGTPSYTVGGTVTGLSGTLVLSNNGGNALTIAANGPFSFSTKLTKGQTYSVTVPTQPAGQICTVTNGSGTVNSANVTNVLVACTNLPYTVGGSVSGLNGTVVLQKNGGDDLTISVNGAFTFSTVQTHQTAYSVTVSSQPAGQICTVTNASGTINAAHVTNVQVACINVYAVGGTVSGLIGAVILQNNGGDNLSVTSNGPFTFSNIVQDGTAYSVTVSSQPVGQTCAITNGSGTISGADVTNVQVACTNIPYTVGGSVSGLLTGTVVLRNNGGDDLTLTSIGPFTFSTTLIHGGAYSVTVSSQPSYETCTVTNGSGTINAADVTNVQVACVDIVAPSAAITFPPAISMTDGNTVTVHGTASDNGTITAVRVNGQDAQTSDGFASWNVTVPLADESNTLTVETEDAAANTDPDAAEAVIKRDIYFNYPSFIALDSNHDRALVSDGGNNAIISLDLLTGNRTVLSDNTTPDANYPFSSPAGIAIDIDNNRALVADMLLSAVISVDLTTGARNILSDNTTPNANNPFSFPDNIAIDGANNRALVVGEGSVIAVDLDTGARSILSDNTTPDAVNPFSFPNGIVVDDANDRALVTDDGVKAVIAVDLNTGSRTILSDATTPNVLNPLTFPRGITLDGANNRALVTNDDVQESVLAVDLTTGARTVISDIGIPNANTPFFEPKGIAVDSADNRALFTDTWRNVVIAMDLTTGARTIFSQSTTPDDISPFFDTTGLAVDGTNNRALVTDHNRAALVAVDLSTGARTILSDSTTPNASSPFGTPDSVVIDDANNRALVTDHYLAAVLAVDLDTGARTILSDGLIPNSMNPFSLPLGIAVDNANNRALVLNAGNNTVLAVNLTTGVRTIFSDSTTPDDVNPFLHLYNGIAIDSDNNRALIIDNGRNAVVAMDLTTGARTIFSDNSTPDANNPFSSVSQGIAIDNDNNRALVWDHGNQAVMEVDLTTGARTILSVTGIPDLNNPIEFLRDIAIDSVNNRILVTDTIITALFGIHPESGERVILSK